MRRALVVLVVAAVAAATQVGTGGGAVDDVTLVADRTVLAANGQVRLRGAISPGRAEETVEIEVKDCGQPAFRQVAGTTTAQGGEWELLYRPGISTTLRAAWKGERSNQIAIQQQATVFLRKRSGGRYEAGVAGQVPFWRKRVTVQQRRSGAWKNVRSVLLTEQFAGPPNPFGGAAQIQTSATFRARFPRGTQLRAVLPLAQARPCYLASVSLTLRA